MRKIIAIALICIVSASTLCGCFDSNEVTEYAFVYSIGLEKGVKDKLRLTVQLSSSNTQVKNNTEDSGVSSKQKGNTLLISVDCPVFFMGVNMINSCLSRELTFNHTMYMVFSEDLAKEGIDSYINGIVRKREVRRDLYCLVAKGSALDFLENNSPALTPSLSKMEQGLLFQSRNTGFFPVTTYRNIIDEIKSPVEQTVLPLGAPNSGKNFYSNKDVDDVHFRSGGSYYAGDLPRKGGIEIELFGSAVFDGGKMVGELTGDETRSLLMIRDEFEKGFFFFEDPLEENKFVILEVRPQKAPKIKVNIKGDKPVVNLKLFLEADIASIQSTIDYDSKDLKPMLELAAKSSIEKQVNKTIDKCIMLKSDVLRFGTYIAKDFATIQELEAYNWLKHFKDCEVHTDIEFIIRRNGTKIYNAPIIESGENH
ncbi:Ger(x)C family spore germination protein [Clostridium sp. C8-1-8]|uniref:Ger(x)C family spore germination protein n=1 Tax=Clostridium sp. C8-1-8 TaxID=2698831 RepID=UPI00136A50D0|nr:Ger(x)C family spore germination protein [Clostridium sp. C8-1-8]